MIDALTISNKDLSKEPTLDLSNCKIGKLEIKNSIVSLNLNDTVVNDALVERNIIFCTQFSNTSFLQESRESAIRRNEYVNIHPTPQQVDAPEGIKSFSNYPTAMHGDLADEKLAPGKKALESCGMNRKNLKEFPEVEKLIEAKQEHIKTGLQRA